MNSCKMRLLQALGILDGTCEPTKAKTRSKTDAARTRRENLVGNPPSNLRVDIKQHGNNLTLVLPRSSAAKRSCMEWSFSAVALAIYVLLGRQYFATGLQSFGLNGRHLSLPVYLLVWCVPSPWQCSFRTKGDAQYCGAIKGAAHHFIIVLFEP
jgi:hypothetical protein